MSTRVERITLDGMEWDITVPKDATPEDVAHAGARAYKAGVLTPANAVKTASTPAPVKEGLPKVSVAPKEAPKPAPVGMLDIAENQLRDGLANGPARLGDALLGLGEAAVGGVRKLAGNTEPWSLGPYIGTEGSKNRKEGLDMRATDVAGFDPNKKATTFGGKVVEGVVDAVNPATGGILMAGGKAALGAVAAAAKAAGKSVPVAVAAKAGSEYGKQALIGSLASAGANSAVEVIKPQSELGQVATGLVGGLVGGNLSALSPTRLLAPKVATAGYSKVREMFKDRLPAEVKEQFNGVVNRRVTNTLSQAVSQDPKVLQRLQEQEALAARTGVSVPTANVNNPVFDEQMRGLVSGGKVTSEGDSVRAVNAATVETAQSNAQKFQKETFGDAGEARAGVQVQDDQFRTVLNESVQAAVADKVKSLEKLDETILRLPYQADSGAKLEAVYKARMGQAREVLSDSYKEVAKSLDYGAYLAQVGGKVKEIPYDPNRSYWQVPKEQLTPLIKDFKVYHDSTFMTSLDKTTQRALQFLKNPEMPPPGFNELDQIKTGVNAALRKAQKGTPEYTKLSRFRDEIVEPMRDLMPPAARQAYKDADTAYAKMIGADAFGAAALKDIDAAKYHLNVSNNLAHNPEAVAQYLKVTGPEGAEAVGDAVLSKLRNDSRMKGQIDEKWLASWSRQHRDVLEQVPSVRERLSSISGTLEALELNAVKAQAAQKEYITKNLIGRHNGDLESAMLDFFSSPTSRGRQMVNEMASKGPQVARVDTLAAMRALTSDYVLRNPDFLKKVEASGEMRKNMQALMGPEFHTQMKDIETLANSMKDRFSFLQNNSKSVSDPVQEAVGVTVPRALAVLFRPIVGVVNKTADLSRTVFNYKSQQAYNERIADLLAGDKGRKELIDILTNLKLGGPGMSDEQIKELAKSYMGKSTSPMKRFISGIIDDAKSGAIVASRTAAVEGVKASDDPVLEKNSVQPLPPASLEGPTEEPL